MTEPRVSDERLDLRDCRAALAEKERLLNESAQIVVDLQAALAQEREAREKAESNYQVLLDAHMEELTTRQEATAACARMREALEEALRHAPTHASAGCGYGSNLQCTCWIGRANGALASGAGETSGVRNEAASGDQARSDSEPKPQTASLPVAELVKRLRESKWKTPESNEAADALEAEAAVIRAARVWRMDLCRIARPPSKHVAELRDAVDALDAEREEK